MRLPCCCERDVDEDDVVKIDSASQIVDDDDGESVNGSGFDGCRVCWSLERAVASLRIVGVTKRDFGRSFVGAVRGVGRERDVAGGILEGGPVAL